jgi:adenosylcobyric acid synthase
VDLLDEDERNRIKGLIINKFRGDKTILEPGVAMIEERANIPVVGVTPYINIQVDDEDSLSSRLEDHREVKLIDIAVIRLPRISNFTDFNPFEMIEGVSLRYVKHAGELGNPDMVILPGTKNTMEDLLWMRQNGLEASILKLAKTGTVIFGICGGYQMLGEHLSDPHGVEAGGEIRGMGLLPMETVFAGQKTRTRVSGSFGKIQGVLSDLSNVVVEGYEIHMGVTTLQEGVNSLTVLGESKKADGAYKDSIYGTYVHGIFDKEQVVKEIVVALGNKKGIDMTQTVAFDMKAFKETQYDILAAELRKHLDMDAIYNILSIKCDNLLTK